MEPGPAVGVDRVVKSFSTVRAVDGLSFEVRHGEIFGFLGPNGAGKTTTLRMIMGITRPDEGRITFGGQPRHDPGKVGYLPEERGLFEEAPVLDVLEYLGMLRGVSDRSPSPGSQGRVGRGTRSEAASPLWAASSTPTMRGRRELLGDLVY